MSVYYEELNLKLLQLDHRDRKVILSSLQEWIDSETKKYKIIPIYWDVLLDFVLCVYGMNLYDIAYEMAYYTDYCVEYKTMGSHSEETKRIYDTLNMVKRSKGNPTKDTEDLMFEFCCYFRISYDILQTGKGEMYIIEDTEKYTMPKIREYINKSGGKEKIKLDEMIKGITGKPISTEVPLQVAVAPIRLNDKIIKYTQMIVENMLKSKDE